MCSSFFSPWLSMPWTFKSLCRLLLVCGMPSVRLPLYYRILFPDLIEARTRSGLIDAPPKITHSSKIDEELYTYLALIVRDFIQPWYQSITLDHGLSTEVTRIVSHCSREIESRCLKVCSGRHVLNKPSITCQDS